MAENTVPYSSIRDALKTGDIVLFQGVGWESDIVEVVELSPWTHVAMVVRVPDIEFPMIWESTPLKYIKDVIYQERKAGARLVSLDERLAVAVGKKLYGRFAVRELEVERTEEMMGALKNFISSEVHDLPYPSDWKMLLGFLRGRLLKEDKFVADNVYCAELVGETYKQMGLLPSNVISNSLTPKDFSPEGRLRLLKGAKLGALNFLDMGKKSRDTGRSYSVTS